MKKGWGVIAIEREFTEYGSTVTSPCNVILHETRHCEQAEEFARNYNRDERDLGDRFLKLMVARVYGVN